MTFELFVTEDVGDLIGVAVGGSFTGKEEGFDAGLGVCISIEVFLVVALGRSEDFN